MAAKDEAKVKPANEVSLAFLVFTRGIPQSREIRLRDCGLAFVDENNHPVEPVDGLISGVFGLASKQMALVVAAQWSKDREYSTSGDNRVLLVDVNYKIDNYHLTRSQINSEILEQTGWLHMERIASKFRKELTEQWLQWIRRDYTDDYARILEQDEVSLLSLAQRHPKYVLRMMKENPSIRAIVHPARLAISPDVVLLAATVRYEPAFFGKALVRFTSDVAVTI